MEAQGKELLEELKVFMEHFMEQQMESFRTELEQQMESFIKRELKQHFGQKFDDLELKLSRLNREIRAMRSLNWLTVSSGISQESDEEIDIVGLPQPASVTGFGSIKRGVNIE